MGTISCNEKSQPCEVYAGVPQELILGPFLFNLYTYDITEDIPSNTTLLQYADDTQMILSFNNHKEVRTIIQEIKCVMKRIKEWSTKNNLCLNISKKQILPIFYKNSAFNRMNFNVHNTLLINFLPKFEF